MDLSACNLSACNARAGAQAGVCAEGRGGAYEQRGGACGASGRVLWRKGSFGTQSVAGSRFVEWRLTVGATLRQQERNVLDYVTFACEAAIRGEAPPSLLPREALLGELSQEA